MEQNEDWGTWDACQQIYDTDNSTYYIQTIPVSSLDINMMSNTLSSTFTAQDATPLHSPKQVMPKLLNLPTVTQLDEQEHSLEPFMRTNTELTTPPNTLGSNLKHSYLMPSTK
jgi:hypothetical protein